MNIYVASSWRNHFQPEIVKDLIRHGHNVYDFHNPQEGNHGFSWSEISENYRLWTTREFRCALDHPLAVEGYNSDINAINNCDLLLMVSPCGKSAHLELAYAAGLGKQTVVLYRETNTEPELMIKMANTILIGKYEYEDWLTKLPIKI